MNKILYETSFIGNPKSFSTHIIDIIQAVGSLILIIYIIKKERSKKEEYSQDNGQYFLYMFKSAFLFVFALIWGVLSCLGVIGTIAGYREVVLGYKRGEYQEVEGIVENYTDSKTHTFTVNGVEFKVSEFVSTWGYTYRHNENVITGDGQHLKIRYIPGSSGSNRIVYIEEIADE